jgi:hypothetical protein
MATVARVATGAPWYVWEDPGETIIVQVSLSLIDRLNEAIQQSLGAGSRGTEIGGILLGRTLPDFDRAVLIDDFELTPSEHLRGASYTLSPKDRRVLGTRLARRPAGQVVGYFRSHTRPGMYLDQDDFAVFSRYFPEAWQVLLLVRPSTEEGATGGFFFWEDGEVNRRSTYRTFPFDTALLAAGDFPIHGGHEGGAEGAVANARGPVPISLPKPDGGQGARWRVPLPPLPWVAVPVIAVLFLISGIFVSVNKHPTPQIADAKSSVPVAPPLAPPTEQSQPDPVPAAAVTEPARVPDAPPVEAAPAQSLPVVQSPPIAQSPPTVQAPTIAKVKRAKKTPVKAVARPTVTFARIPAREVEPPPALSVPVGAGEPKVVAMLAPRVTTAAPFEVDVTYETPPVGVFRRAFRKIEGPDAFVPPSPIRKVAPVKAPTQAGEAGGKPVDVKVFIDDSGNVSRVQVLTKGSDRASAASSAARQWHFSPARKHDKPVSSEMILHFR